MTFKSFETFLRNVVEFWSTLKGFFHTCSCLLSHPCSIPLFNGMIFLKSIYKITVQTLKPGHLEEDVQSQRFLKTNSQDSQVFLQRDQWNSRFNYTTVKNWKLLSNFWMLFVRLLKKILRIFCFQKTLWLDTLLQSVPNWVSALSMKC